jgi:hypothetical protein
LPSVLRTVAEWNPVTAVAGGLRHLFGNPDTVVRADSPWPLHHPVLYSALWIVLIIGICAPLAGRMYQRSITS